jgi:hypothetical protein
MGKKLLMLCVLFATLAALSFAGGIGEYKGNNYLIGYYASSTAAEWSSSGKLIEGTEAAISGDKFFFIGIAGVSSPVISRGTIVSGDPIILWKGEITFSNNAIDTIYATYTGPRFSFSAITYDITENGLWVAGYADSKIKKITVTDIFLSKEDVDAKVRYKE